MCTLSPPPPLTLRTSTPTHNVPIVSPTGTPTPIMCNGYMRVGYGETMETMVHYCLPPSPTSCALLSPPSPPNNAHCFPLPPPPPNNAHCFPLPPPPYIWIYEGGNGERQCAFHIWVYKDGGGGSGARQQCA
jgi:hypothetical protein